MADNEGQHLLRLLWDDEDALLQRWVKAASVHLQGQAAASELERSFRDLVTALSKAISVAGLDLDDEGYGEVRALLAELSRDRARRGFTPSETAVSVFALKDALFEVAMESEQPSAALITASRWVDGLGLLTMDSYTRAREEVIAEQAEQLLELSTPVVKLWDGVVAVPLVGTLDSARTQIVMEKLLQTLVDTGSEHAIIDITGVPAVDTEVAQHLLKTVVAARLMGAECTISGIRPQIAQTIVTLGIEFGDIPTKASLADALLHALRGSGVEVVRRRTGAVR
ncbi:STAS domain-containing protein [Pseudonocardia charpentierae]|uniref:STAS domain-containing protein n=1 Tax=Pseudonocardia charpentierae TaxID=3075545 RepID=A0ABU2N5Q2_9PSEU|nr:STAS domain-containing protein [Pseudonocardia sp. DSM 45834]MDT0349090.1 STAS domain-containing protein [Pseudonocardia sp. DSM 45834]